jgi:Holliday junction resolvase
MPINSRDKGQRGERMWRDELRAAGFDAHRGQQFCGSKDSPDVVCDALPSVHFEVKYTEKFNAYDAMAQAKRDAGDYKLPVVAHRRNNHDWLVIMPAQDWLSLIKETGRVMTIFCPDCKSSNVQKYDATIKSKLRYKCLNPNCVRVIFTV